MNLHFYTFIHLGMLVQNALKFLLGFGQVRSAWMHAIAAALNNPKPITVGAETPAISISHRTTTTQHHQSQVSYYLGYSALTDHFPTEILHPNPDCGNAACRAAQARD